ncbi:MAG: linked oxidase [Gemmatimonadetes bacterium]|nr:linked oxidase [Gemmatimonadota bacterium]
MNVSRDLDVRNAYARDASGLELIPDAVARPTTIEEAVDLVRSAVADRTPITAAGAQTSTTAASIVDRGVLLSMAAMAKTLDVDPVSLVARVQPGVTVGALNAQLAEMGLRFAPDPTSEHDATIGGAIACNASGARSLRYGPTRAHVRSVHLINGSGQLVHLRRPQLEKNTVGFFAAQDPVDWIVGSEGTLGVIVEAELSLVPLPAHELGLALPFTGEHEALAFVAAARERGDAAPVQRPQCLEFFDESALAIARDAVGGSWMQSAKALVYLEQAFEADEETDAVLDRWLSLGEQFGVDAADIAVYADAAALRDARRFRHAVPAHMNERGSARRPHGGRKVSTDWAVPYRRLADALDSARRLADVHGVEQAVTYGHAGNGHPHQNFIANDADELRQINGVVDETIAMVLGMGGTVAAEHGLGKLKRHWLRVQLSPAQLDVMQAIKNALDPLGLFAPGNVL